MKEPIILEGEPFDWEEGHRLHMQYGGMRGAMCADPGVMSCPACHEFLWKEGIRVRCPHCSHDFLVNDAVRLAQERYRRGDPCPACKGTGKRLVESDHGSGQQRVYVPCPRGCQVPGISDGSGEQK